MSQQVLERAERTLRMVPATDDHCRQIAALTADDPMMGNIPALAPRVLDSWENSTPTPIAFVTETGEPVCVAGVILLPAFERRTGFVWLAVQEEFRRRPVAVGRLTRPLVQKLLNPKGLPPYDCLVTWIRPRLDHLRYVMFAGFELGEKRETGRLGLPLVEARFARR